MSGTRYQWRLDFGTRLANARIAKGLSQRELAVKAGMNKNMLGHYEQGRHEPTAHVIASLCRVLGASADVLLGLEEV